MESEPVVAPTGTIAVILVELLAVTNAVIPLNFIVLFNGVVLKFVPVMITGVPIEPLVGLKPEEVNMGNDETVF
jgi:hypothetical protein